MKSITNNFGSKKFILGNMADQTGTFAVKVRGSLRRHRLLWFRHFLPCLPLNESSPDPFDTKLTEVWNVIDENSHSLDYIRRWDSPRCSKAE